MGSLRRPPAAATGLALLALALAASLGACEEIVQYTPGGDGGQDAGDGGDGGGGGDGGSDAGVPPCTDLDAGCVRVRVVAANLSSGNFFNYDGGEGVRILQGLRPDIILIQEWRVGSGSPAELRTFVNQVCGMGCSYFREPLTGDTGSLIPNGIISRYPILDAGEWADVAVPDRDFVWAVMDVPGPRHLFALSLHLYSSGGPTGRDGEGAVLVTNLATAVPAGALLLVGGDLNTDNRSEPLIGTLSQVVVTTGPYPADQAGNGDTNQPRNKPYDWLLPDQDLQASELPLLIGQNAFPSGLVLDTRFYTPLADLSPALAGDSDAGGMQHMAVAKDYGLPAGP